MNKENILKVADAIEAGAPDLGFNMDWYYYQGNVEDRSGRHCNTVACLAGWAALVEGGDARSGTTYSVADYFNISDEVARRLTHPVHHWNATDKQAIRTLRHFAETGFVNWDLEETQNAN